MQLTSMIYHDLSFTSSSDANDDGSDDDGNKPVWITALDVGVLSGVRSVETITCATADARQ
jgi:hypothetical protein